MPAWLAVRSVRPRARAASIALVGVALGAPGCAMDFDAAFEGISVPPIAPDAHQDGRADVSTPSDSAAGSGGSALDAGVGAEAGDGPRGDSGAPSDGALADSIDADVLASDGDAGPWDADSGKPDADAGAVDAIAPDADAEAAVCPGSTQTPCPGVGCVDLGTDPSHCGACGRTCSGTNVVSRVCAAGRCVSTCAFAWSNCTQPAAPADDDGCEQAATDARCGSCVNDCTTQGTGPGMTCLAVPQLGKAACGCSVAGACAVPGGPNDSCSSSHLCVCGGHTCAYGEACRLQGGVGTACSCNGGAACPMSQACCKTPPGCTDLDTDSASCGACGRACATGFVCSGGHCACSADAVCNAGSTGSCNAQGRCVCKGATCAYGARCVAGGSCG